MSDPTPATLATLAAKVAEQHQTTAAARVRAEKLRSVSTLLAGGKK